MEHRMILATADLKKIHAVVVLKRNASLVEREQRLIRNEQDAVRGRDEAPDSEEVA